MSAQPTLESSVTSDRAETTVLLKADRATHFLLVSVLTLLAMHVIVQFAASRVILSQSLIEFTNLDKEKSLGTLFAVLEWSAATYLLYRMSTFRSSVGTRMQWISLMFVSAFLTIDEFCSIHEKISAHLHSAFQTKGLLVYAWIIPYGVCLGVLTFMMFGLWRSLPRSTRKMFFFAGIVFSSGAVGVEMFEGRHAASHGTDLAYYLAFVSLEETLEMAGVAIFLVALIKLIGGIQRCYQIERLIE